VVAVEAPQAPLGRDVRIGGAVASNCVKTSTFSCRAASTPGIWRSRASQLGPGPAIGGFC